MFKYTLSEKDIITYMLYYLSSNRKTRNMSKKTLWIYSGCLIMMAIICYAIGDIIASIVISWLTIFLVIYTLFLRNYLMTKAMKRIAVRDMKDMIGSNIQLEINEDHLHFTDQAGEYKYLYSGFILISESSSYYFIKLNNSQCIIIPKINNEMEQSMKSMIARYSLAHKLQLDIKV